MIEVETRKLISLADFEDRAEEYFKNCEEDGIKPTFAKLIIHIGFRSKASFYSYRKDPLYAEICEWCRLMIEGEYEQQLANGRGDGGVVFALKNFGWKDKQEIANKNVEMTHEEWLDNLE